MDEGEQGEENIDSDEENCSQDEQDVEDILSILVRAAVAKAGVESVVESMVSVVGAHTPASRAIILQNRLEDKTIVSWNDEDIKHCDPIVKETIWAYTSQYKMRSHREGHFVRRNENIKPYLISEADTLMKKPAKLPVMLEK